jgi:hypothetical protein
VHIGDVPHAFYVERMDLGAKGIAHLAGGAGEINRNPARAGLNKPGLNAVP